ncbi:MAG: hypothetical protein IJ860_08075 [Eubacterium sp.]|nr:hypothetical protein [Eubacterium sp.]
MEQKKKAAVGGYPFFGQDLGAVMLPVQSPALPGNVGNAASFSYPVRYRTLKGFNPDWWNDEEGPSEERYQTILGAAKELEEEGVKAVTFGCGFTGVYQNRLAEELNIPVMGSPLVMAPLIQRLIGKNKKIGIFTINADELRPELFEAVGIKEEEINYVVGEMQDAPEFRAVYCGGGKKELDIEAFREETVANAVRIKEENPDLGAFLIEFRTIGAFTADIAAATGLPVFDGTALANFVHQATNPKPFV